MLVMHKIDDIKLNFFVCSNFIKFFYESQTIFNQMIRKINFIDVEKTLNA